MCVVGFQREGVVVFPGGGGGRGLPKDSVGSYSLGLQPFSYSQTNKQTPNLNKVKNSRTCCEPGLLWHNNVLVFYLKC